MTDDGGTAVSDDIVVDDALATLGQYVVVLDGDGRLLRWGDRFASAVGRSDAALESAPLSTVVRGNGDAGGRVEAAVERALSEGAASAEVTVGGGDAAVAHELRLVAADDGREAALVGVFDERRVGGVEVQSRALDRMTDAFFALDDDWRLTYVNERARPILAGAMSVGEGSELVGRNLWESVPAAVDTQFYRKYHEAVETGEPVTVEAEYDPLDTVFEVRAYPSETGLSVYLRDVTDRRERQRELAERERVFRGMYEITSDTERDFEEQVGALIELAQEVLDADYGVLSRIEGEDYVHRVVRSPGGVVEPGTRVPLSATVCERTATEEERVVLADIVEDDPETADRTEESESEWEWNWDVNCYVGAPVFADGEVYGTFCFYDGQPQSGGFSEWETTMVDLMAQWMSYELTHHRASERLRRQNERLEEFVSVVSHDLRNPLETLSGHLEFAEETGDEEHFEWCRRAVDRMDALIDDLLALARAGDAVGDTERVDLADLARESWALVDAESATVVVETERTVEADRSRLRQLFENLLRNAVEHAGPDVTVTVGDTETGFYVADDGPGVPAEDREQVFEAGFSTARDGTGFGLKIVESVAEAHGWSVALTEAADGGARFECTL
jgi:signal transduction histidine kinase